MRLPTAAWAVVLPSLIAPSCASSDGAARGTTDPDEASAVLEAYLTESLADGAVAVMPLTPMLAEGDAFVDNVPWQAVDAGDGATLVHVATFGPTGAQAFSFRGQAASAVFDDGGVTILPRPADAPPFPVSQPTTGYPCGLKLESVPLADGALILECWVSGFAGGTCPPDEVNVGLAYTTSGGTYTAVPQVDALCGRQVLGRSAVPSRVARLAAAGSTVSFEARGLSAGTPVVASASADAGGGVSNVLYVEEISDGSFVGLVLADSAGDNAFRPVFVRSGLAPIASSGIGNTFGSPVVHRDAATGEFTIVAGSGAYGWNPTAGPPVSMVLPEPPNDQVVWRLLPTGVGLLEVAATNPLMQTARIPEAYRVFERVGASLVARDVATTPCTSRKTCRMWGESYLVGAAPNPAGTIGLYAFWSWYQSIGFFVAPVDRPDEPAPPQ